MYSNVGRKIKGLAQIIGGIGLILAILVCIVVAVFMSNIGGGLLGLIEGLVIGGIIFLFFWISTWILHGFGTVVECAEKQTRYLQVLADPEKTLFKEDEEGKSGAEAAGYFCDACGHPGPYESACPKCGSMRRAYTRPYGSRCYSDEGKREVHFYKKKTGTVVCPKCNTEQPAGNFCPSCGYAFTYDE